MSQLAFATAKVKTIQADSTITAATNASPIAVTTSAPHLLETGDIVQISGAVTLTAANGRFVVTKTGASTFTLNNSNGNGTWASGGTVKHIGFATAAVLVDNTVFTTAPDFMLQARIESLTSGANVRFEFVDSADSLFVTAQPIVTFQAPGPIASNLSADKMFTVKKYDVPDTRIAASGNNMKANVYVSGGPGAVAQFSAWLAY